MKRSTTLALTTGLLLCLGLALPSGDAVGQQQTAATLHRYLVRADLTPEGLKNLQKQPPTALKAGVPTRAYFARVESGGFTAVCQ
jgi:hypothetical protein